MNREIDIARYIIEKTNYNLFLTGKAGTGKTTFIRDVTAHTSKKFIVLAPTGIAAVNVGAMTIHSFFQFGFGPYVKGISEPVPSFHLRKQKLELIRNLELIIIDEISMVRADLLDHIDEELKRIRRNRKPFGGVQMVFTGDLQQLPPIAGNNESVILSSHYKSLYFFDSDILSTTPYYCIELKKVYRQADSEFVELLNHARDGRLTESDIRQLNSRFIPGFVPNNSGNYIRLVTHNYQADHINEQELESIQSKEYTFNADISKDFPKDSFPTSSSLVLKKNAQVMFIKNDPDKEFVNGTLGLVTSINENSIYVYIPTTGKSVEVKPMAWENIRYRLNEETGVIETEVKGTFKQYPLKPAWAITIHKSQGLTFDRAIIDIHAAFSPGQAYVALSRCRTLEGIVFTSMISPSIFITDNIVREYINRISLDIEVIAFTIGYTYFDYDRTVATPAKAIPTTKKSYQPASLKKEQGVAHALRKWRLEKANEIGKPAYCVFDNKTLEGLSEACPSTINELLLVKGIGQVKAKAYGEDILRVIASSL